MNLPYAAKELYHRRRRTLTAILGLAVGIALLVTINALAMAYRRAAVAPLKEIGADITVQRSGDVPREMTGPVFPCSAVTIRRDEVDKIRQLPGVRAVGTAILLWVFDPQRASVVMGLEPENKVGPGILRSSVTEGRFIGEGKAEALVEAAYARQFTIKVGDTLRIADREFTVVGIVDASRSSKIATANVYLPLAEAQGMAASSKQLQSVTPFSAGDVNLLFINADQAKITSLAANLKTIIGKKSTIATPESFLESLGSLFALSDKFALVASLIAIVIAALVTVKVMLGNISERAQEIGILKAVGWTDHNVTLQLTVESVVQAMLGGAVGLLLAWVVTWGLSFMTIDIPIPWEMNPTPHFLPGGGAPVFKTLSLPAHIPWTLAGFAMLLSVLIGGVTGWLLSRHIASIKPSEVLRHE